MGISKALLKSDIGDDEVSLPNRLQASDLSPYHRSTDDEPSNAAMYISSKTGNGIVHSIGR